MWRVEIKTEVRESQPYELFDQFLSRAIARAGLLDVSQLATFFGVDRALVDRVITFLETIGHVRRSGDALTLTGIGQQSVADGCRYVEKKGRQVLYFDGFTSEPMPATHYEGTEWIDDIELTLNADGTRFRVVTGSRSFNFEALERLASRPDREEFNLPGSVSSIKPIDVGSAFLPAYVVECTERLLVFVKAMDGPDEYLADLVSTVLPDVLAAEDRVDDMRTWQDWLRARGLENIRPERLPNNILRASLPAKEYGRRISWWQLGSFEVHRASFLQLWCDDAEARQHAVLDRVGRIVKTRVIRDADELGRRFSDLAGQLQVTTPGIADLRRFAREENDESLLSMVEDLLTT